MKITSPIAIKSAALLAAWIIRGWLATCDVKVVFADPQFKPEQGRRYLFGFWHENILPVAYCHCCKHVATLVSRHRDGELITQVINRFGGKTFRGSTTRGGAAALRNMILKSQNVNLGITPDGPKGPRREVQNGAIYLAGKTQMPLVPLAFGAQKYWRAGSWDKMLLPKPFCKIRGVFGNPVTVPDNLDRREIEEYRLKFQQAMLETQQAADKLACGENNRPDAMPREQINSVWINALG